jgi:hypothetical protein
MTKSIVGAALFLTALTLFTAPASLAASEIRVERVQFKRGANSAVIEGKITGHEIVDYVLRIREGQAMNVSMATKHGATYFNILAPGEDQVAMFNGSMHENQFEGVAPKSGEYKVRVYMMRSAARRNEVANYRLEMIVTGAASSAAPAASGRMRHDAKVKGTNYHATGNVPCRMKPGQPTGSCPFGVTREGGGNGTVTITKPDGRTRAIFFQKGKAVGADVSQADPGGFSARRESDLNIIDIGAERYEIPDAVVFGG